MVSEFDEFVPQYLWSKTIKELDDYKCVYCGSTERLQAHHIFHWSEYPELSASLRNGATLCYSCHRKAHSCGFHVTREDMKKFPWYYEGIYAFLEDRFESSVILTVPKGEKAKIKAHAESMGESVNGFIYRDIENQIENDRKDK